MSKINSYHVLKATLPRRRWESSLRQVYSRYSGAKNLTCKHRFTADGGDRFHGGDEIPRRDICNLGTAAKRTYLASNNSPPNGEMITIQGECICVGEREDTHGSTVLTRWLGLGKDLPQTRPSYWDGQTLTDEHYLGPNSKWIGWMLTNLSMPELSHHHFPSSVCQQMAQSSFGPTMPHNQDKPPFDQALLAHT